MTYIAPFAVLKRRYKVSATADVDRVAISYRDLQELVRSVLRGVNVDEAWYLRQYPDVEEAVRSGIFKSAKHHFVQNGYFEGRRPSHCSVDEDWYLLTYPDVAHAIDAEQLMNAAEHFYSSGYEEGRLPSEY